MPGHESPPAVYRALGTIVNPGADEEYGMKYVDLARWLLAADDRLRAMQPVVTFGPPGAAATYGRPMATCEHVTAHFTGGTPTGFRCTVCGAAV